MNMDKYIGGLKKFYRDESGITGLETAIILIAFIVVAAVFAFTIMTTGLFSTEKAKTTAQAGIAEASSTFAPKGAVVAATSVAVTTTVDTISFQLTLASGSEESNIDPEALAFIYTDDNSRHSTSGGAGLTGGIIESITISKIVGVQNSLLKGGEVAEVVVNLRQVTAPGFTALGPDQTFRVEIIPPAGGSLILERRTPIAMSSVMNLE